METIAQEIYYDTQSHPSISGTVDVYNCEECWSSLVCRWVGDVNPVPSSPLSSTPGCGQRDALLRRLHLAFSE